MLPAGLHEALTRKLGPLRQIDSLSGGSIHHALRLTTAEGTYVCKWNTASSRDNFLAEAQGLEQLRQTHTLRVPVCIGLIDCDESVGLLLEDLTPAPRRPDYWQSLGQGLAELHRHDVPFYGYGQDNFIGRLPQVNTPTEDFHSFWHDHRLWPLFSRAWSQLNSQDRHRAGYLLTHLEQILPADPPALLHGDLWSGNILSDAQGKPCLIDPAVYYGPREAELAFTRLFGGFAPAFYSAYNEAHPLLPGWKDRVEIYNLYPLLVHFHMFGNSYLPQIQAVLKRFG